MEDSSAATLRDHYGTVYRFVRRRVSSREDAEDLTQEVFTAAADALQRARLDAGTPTLAWLYTVARRRLVDRFRAAQPVTVELPDDLAQRERVFGIRVTRALIESLERLDNGQRTVVVQKLLEGRSFAEIAARAGVSEEACRMRFSRGLVNLRTLLSERGVEP